MTAAGTTTRAIIQIHSKFEVLPSQIHAIEGLSQNLIWQQSISHGRPWLSGNSD